MKVLVGTADANERQRIAKALAKECTVSQAASCGAAAHATAVERPDLAIIESAWVTTVRKASGDRQYVAALIAAKPSPTDFWAAYAAGADDALRSSACCEEIVGRLAPFKRLRSLQTASAKIARIRVWEALEAIVTNELGALLGTTLGPTSAPDGVVETGEIELTLCSESVTLRLGFGVDAATSNALRQNLLGGDGRAEALQDALREMANTAAGAIKRAAIDDGVSLTIGLPTNDNVFAMRSKQRRWACGGDGLVISCVATVNSNQPASILAAELREGMVLARDVVNPTGMLLAPAGTYVTRTTAEQLARLLGNSSVEVTGIRSAA